jgi:hypothetical protein
LTKIARLKTSDKSIKKTWVKVIENVKIGGHRREIGIEIRREISKSKKI